MREEICPDCKHFHGYDDGWNDTLTHCRKIGDFEGIKKACHDFEKEITIKDLTEEIAQLKEENRKLKAEIKQLQERRLEQCIWRKYITTTSEKTATGCPTSTKPKATKKS